MGSCERDQLVHTRPSQNRMSPCLGPQPLQPWRASSGRAHPLSCSSQGQAELFPNFVFSPVLNTLCLKSVLLLSFFCAAAASDSGVEVKRDCLAAMYDSKIVSPRAAVCIPHMLCVWICQGTAKCCLGSEGCSLCSQGRHSGTPNLQDK